MSVEPLAFQSAEQGIGLLFCRGPAVQCPIRIRLGLSLGATLALARLAEVHEVRHGLARADHLLGPDQRIEFLAGDEAEPHGFLA